MFAYHRLSRKLVSVAEELILVKTLEASLLASVIGTGAWILGITKKMWPAHPQWAVFFLTLGATVVLLYLLPDPKANNQKNGAG